MGRADLWQSCSEVPDTDKVVQCWIIRKWLDKKGLEKIVYGDCSSEKKGGSKLP